MELLTVDEAARILRLNPITIRRYIAEGRLVGFKVGQRVRVPREALDDFARPVAVRGARYRRPPAGKVFSEDDRLWRIVGAFESGTADVSLDKQKYLAEAYETRSQ